MSYYTTSLIAKSFPHSVRDEKEATILYDRAQLDRRHLEEAFIKCSVLQISKHYPEQFRDIAFGSTIEETLEQITPLSYQVFSRRYMGTSLYTCIQVASYIFYDAISP